MDPEQALNDLLGAIADCDRTAAYDALDAMLSWRSRGGFMPVWQIAVEYDSQGRPQ